MTASARARLVFALAAAALAGCDPVWLLEARITVPVGAQRADPVYPQAVLVRFEHAWDTLQIVAVVCGPTESDVHFDVEIGGLGARGPSGTVTAWLEPVPAWDDPPCGVIPYGEGVPEHDPPAWAWRASAEAFEWGLGDRDGVTLVLADPSASNG